MTGSRPTLDYTHLRPPRRWRRASVLKLAALAVLFAGVFAGGTRFGTVARAQVPMLFGPAVAVRALQADAEAAGPIVVFDEHPLRAAELLPLREYLNPVAGGRVMALRSDPRARDAYEVLGGGDVSPLDFGASALLAEMMTAEGARRVVSVRYLPEGLPGAAAGGLAGFLVETFDLSGLMPRPRRVFSAFAADVRAAGPDAPAPLLGQRDLRVFAGKIDPDDPAHFTVAYESGGVAGVLDGYLRDDGRTVDVELRGAALRRLAETSRDTIPVQYLPPIPPDALRRLP